MCAENCTVRKPQRQQQPVQPQGFGLPVVTAISPVPDIAEFTNAQFRSVRHCYESCSWLIKQNETIRASLDEALRTRRAFCQAVKRLAPITSATLPVDVHLMYDEVMRNIEVDIPIAQSQNYSNFLKLAHWQQVLRDKLQAEAQAALTPTVTHNTQHTPGVEMRPDENGKIKPRAARTPSGDQKYPALEGRRSSFTPMQIANHLGMQWLGVLEVSTGFFPFPSQMVPAHLGEPSGEPIYWKQQKKRRNDRMASAAVTQALDEADGLYGPTLLSPPPTKRHCAQPHDRVATLEVKSRKRGFPGATEGEESDPLLLEPGAKRICIRLDNVEVGDAGDDAMDIEGVE